MMSQIKKRKSLQESEPEKIEKYEFPVNPWDD